MQVQASYQMTEAKNWNPISEEITFQNINIPGSNLSCNIFQDDSIPSNQSAFSLHQSQSSNMLPMKAVAAYSEQRYYSSRPADMLQSHVASRGYREYTSYHLPRESHVEFVPPLTQNISIPPLRCIHEALGTRNPNRSVSMIHTHKPLFHNSLVSKVHLIKKPKSIHKYRKELNNGSLVNINRNHVIKEQVVQIGRRYFDFGESSKQGGQAIPSDVSTKLNKTRMKQNRIKKLWRQAYLKVSSIYAFRKAGQSNDALCLMEFFKAVNNSCE